MLRIKSVSEDSSTDNSTIISSENQSPYLKEDKRLLIVDDERYILFALRELFSPLYNVRTAESGAAALEIIQGGFIPQVIIADQRMPGMSGTEFLSKTIQYVPQTVRVVLTGYTDVKDLTDSINQGNVYRFLTKPWRNADLKEIIRVCFQHYYLSEEKVALTNALERLEYINREKTELLSIVAHDLKNPLAVIIGMADAIVAGAENGFSHENYERIATDIIGVSERMVKLISNLLNAQAIEDGKLALNIIALNVVPIIALDIQELQIPASQKNIQIVLTADGEPQVAVDEVWFHHVIANLVSNAVKYSPEGKTVHVRIQTLEKNVQIRVQDDGPGISAEEQSRLFQRFEKLSTRPTAGENSSGLGLSTVKKLIELMKGRVWCESSVGHGATFIIELPRVIH